jgi:hypothetical protein
MVHYVAYGTPGGEFPAGVCRAAVITDGGSAGGACDRYSPNWKPRFSASVIKDSRVSASAS